MNCCWPGLPAPNDAPARGLLCRTRAACPPDAVAPRSGDEPGRWRRWPTRTRSENWGFLPDAARHAGLRAGTSRMAIRHHVREGRALPVVFYDQLVQLILRNALDGCEDVQVLRAAEMFFRPQRGACEGRRAAAGRRGTGGTGTGTAFQPADGHVEWRGGRRWTFWAAATAGPTGAGPTPIPWCCNLAATPRPGPAWRRRLPPLCATCWGWR
jgi:hypothetical protein